jgi:hypothetical protein
VKRLIVIENIAPASLFRLLFIGFAFSIGPCWILFAILRMIEGSSLITVNHKPVVGMNGFLLSLVVTPIWALLLAAFTWVCVMIGIRLYTEVGWRLKLSATEQV